MISREFPIGKSIIFVGLVTVLAIDIVTSFSVSVPPVKSVCKSMHPGHDKYKPQESDSPYLISTDVTEIPSGGVVEGNKINL